MRKPLRITLVGLLILTLGVNSATACHFFKGYWGCYRPQPCGYVYAPGGCPTYVYRNPCRPVCDPCGRVVTVYQSDPCQPCGVETSPRALAPQQAGPSVQQAAPSIPIAPEPVHATTPEPVEYLVVPTMTPEPTFPESSEPAPIPIPDSIEVDQPQQSILSSEPPAEPRYDLLADPADSPLEVLTPPPAEEAEDLFSPVETEELPITPKEESLDDLLRSLPEEPSIPAEVEDDLFSTFGTPSEEPSSEPEVVEEPASPEEPTSTEEDDLFGDSSSSEDLFGGSVADRVEEDFFEEPFEPFEESAMPEEDLSDDLFDEPDDSTPADPSSTEEESPESAPSSDEDDLFGNFGAILREPGGLASSEMRHWTDNTGRYGCYGRLLHADDGQVRLLKDNGRTSTVPFYRLSQKDLTFVDRQASAQQAEIMGQVAHR